MRLRGLLRVGAKLVGAGFVVGAGAALANAGWGEGIADVLLGCGVADLAVFAACNVIAPGAPLPWGFAVEADERGVRIEWGGRKQDEEGRQPYATLDPRPWGWIPQGPVYSRPLPGERPPFPVHHWIRPVTDEAGGPTWVSVTEEHRDAIGHEDCPACLGWRRSYHGLG